MKQLALSSVGFVAACQKEEIIASVKTNPKKSAQQQEPYQSRVHLFDNQLYENS